ncbi:conserved hypothetical protein [Leishmania braziliensis MHOM/BR/75/M2904]|uniref:Cyclic nucleotide-binding domain-containing protein n=1 Tax=Leishmania braziliensis TaxID=5660 RepID=A4HC89_LEIBR|nr:conserved hypothetical protein [Leishmania braziliensis MHOM/BR/75/M2904]CAJ2472757.1 unnamed protein product [Leishmania braziliensis]CAM45082.2 conserved hypothetical protein [Leishmania braziliensis MHOM/BR/75/M2904]
MPMLSDLTVAEQVAALPPLPQLLGIHPPEPANPQTKVTRQASDRLVSSRTGASSAMKISPPQTRSAVTRWQPSSRIPATMSQTVKSLSTEAKLGALVSSPDVREEDQLPLAPSTPHPVECSRSMHEWRRVQQSLQLPIAYRTEEDIHLSLRLLRSLPLFAPLLDDDLLMLAETMEVMEVTGAGTVLLRKCSVDQATHLSSYAGVAAAEVTTTCAEKLPWRSLPSSSHVPQVLEEEEEEHERSQLIWTVPAAHLFKCFREQMRRGEPPSLPSGFTDGVRTNIGSAHSPITANKENRRSMGASPLQSLTGVARLPTTRVTTAPLFSLGDDDGVEDGGEAFALVLLSGHCRLEWPRERGPMEDSTETLRWQSYELQPGDAMGYALIWAALPPAAQYVTSESSRLLLVSSKGRPAEVAVRLRRVCGRANEAVLRAQRQFLMHNLSVQLFDPDDPASRTAHTTGSGEGRTPRESRPHDHVAATVVEAAAAAAEPAVPGIASLLEEAARNLIPIRVPTQTVLFREGLTPVTECAIYFILSGGLSVVRRVWSQDQKRLLGERDRLVRALTPATGVCPPMPPLPATDRMEIAQLRPGDYCGDLAYLNEDPDHVTSIDAKWTASYWQNTLAQPTAPCSPGGRCGAVPECSHNVTTSTPDDGGDSSLFRRHKGTVIAQQASSLYVLLPRAADRALVGAVLQRMRDHIHRKYAGYRDVFANYDKVYKWALYKERVLCDVSKKAPMNFR